MVSPDLFERQFPLNILDENKGIFSDEFIAWLPKNLHIFAEFCSRAKALKRVGRKRFGASEIVGAIRFDTYLREKPEYEFKINNNYTAYLARLCMIAYPETEGLFEIRERKLKYCFDASKKPDFIGENSY